MSEQTVTPENPDGLLGRARSLLGHNVTVSLGEDVVARGRLLSISESGEIVTVDEMGFVGWSWPMLDISEFTATIDDD